MNKVASVKVVRSDGSESVVVDPMPAAHGVLNQLLGAERASEALYAHLGHGRWTSFLLKTLKDALSTAEDVPLTAEEEAAVQNAIDNATGAK